jgi:hypothetical protein
MASGYCLSRTFKFDETRQLRGSLKNKNGGQIKMGVTH